MDDVTTRLSRALTGRYTIESDISSGGMATVYAANDLRHHRRAVGRPPYQTVILFSGRDRAAQPVGGDSARV